MIVPFSQKAFFKIGIFCFAVVALANTVGLLIEWSILPGWAKLARLGSVTFNYALVYFFYWLLKTTPDTEEDPYYQMSDEELEKFLKEKNTEVKKKDTRKPVQNVK